MEKHKTILSCLLAITGLGTFLPIMTLPVIGNFKYITGDGIYLCLLCMIAFTFVQWEMFHTALIPVGINFIMLARVGYEFHKGLESMAVQKSDSPLTKVFSQALVNRCELGIGFWVMLAGTSFTAFFILKGKSNVNQN